jgi:nitrite reductase/ring-hydroxylating ferredoxin subunit
VSGILQVDWQKLAGAPATGTRLCALDSLTSGEARLFTFNTAEPGSPHFSLILFRYGESVNGWYNQCPHHWLPMQRRDGKFLMWSDTELMCTHHSAVFNLAEEGQCTIGPCQGANLIRVPVTVQDGYILVGLI